MNKKYIPFIGVGVIVMIVLGGIFMGKPANKTSQTNQGATYDTIFPLPTNVSVFTKASGDAVNFQTTLNVKDSESFYRTELTKMGLKERTITTSVTDTTFSMVFDGYKNGKAVVVQGVDISGKTNINMRFEQI